jgi:hypothetical protein
MYKYGVFNGRIMGKSWEHFGTIIKLMGFMTPANPMLLTPATEVHASNYLSVGMGQNSLGE